MQRLPASTASTRRMGGLNPRGLRMEGAGVTLLGFVTVGGIVENDAIAGVVQNGGGDEDE